MNKKAMQPSRAMRFLLSVVLAFGLVPGLGLVSPPHAAADVGDVPNMQQGGAPQAPSDEGLPESESPESGGTGSSGVEEGDVSANDAPAKPDEPIATPEALVSLAEAQDGEVELRAEAEIDLSALAANSTIAIDETSVVAGGSSVAHDGTVVLKGSSAASDATVTVASSFQGTIVLDGVNLEKTDASTMSLQPGAVVDLHVRGAGNSIKNSATAATRSYAVISVPAGAELTVSGETDSGTDSLAIEANHTRANSSSAIVTSGAVIGSAANTDSGLITIKNVALFVAAQTENTATATTMYPGAGVRGAIIGSGYIGVAGSISVNDAIIDITATPIVAGSNAAGGVSGALIGSGSGDTMNYSTIAVTSGDITIERSQVTAIAKAAQGSNSGAVIGSGAYGSAGGTILLSDSTVKAVSGSSGTAYGAAIGSGRYGSVSAIEIDGGDVFAVVEASDGTYGAGIGSGEGKNATTNRVSVGSILIDGNPSVVASSQVPRDSATTLFDTGLGLAIPTSASTSGAGIGGGKDADVTSIVINSGTIKAANLAGSATNGGFSFGPGIGAGGRHSSGKGGVLGTVTINGGIVEATSNGWTSNSHAIGAGDGSNLRKGTVVINGGTVVAKSKPINPTVSNGRNGIGAESVVIDGGSVFSEYGGQKDIGIIGYGDGNWKNSQGALIFPSVLSLGAASASVTAGSIDGVACAEVPGAGVYGINDVVSDADGTVYLWLPETGDGEEGSVELTALDAGASKDYAIEYVRNSAVDRNIYDLSSWNAYHPAPMTRYVTVSFVTNTAQALADERVAVGSQLAEPSGLSKEDHTLAGWHTDPGYATKWDFADPVTEGMTLYAKWEAPTSLDVLNVARLYGADRFDTSKNVATYERDIATEKTLIIASGADQHFPDALAASSLSGAHDNAPIVLSQPDYLGDAARSVVEAAQAVEKIYIIGSEYSVSAEVEQALEALHPAAEIVRLGGEGRQQTAELIYQELGSSASKTAILARSMEFPDSLSISPWAAATNSPIFLSSFDEQSFFPSTLDALRTGGFDRVIVLGDAFSIPESAVESVRAAMGLAETDVIRLGGDDRIETSLIVAEWATDAARGNAERLSFDKLAVTRADKHADALAGGALQGLHASVVLLTPTHTVHQDVLAKIAAASDDISEIRFLGDEYAIAIDVVKAYIMAIPCDEHAWKPDDSVRIDLS
ncbi:cell wall-binding repeat-containing protein [Raoultibacter phocaeensis]|uniref:cell wall-binding repeat-containing protein n=1 Tax=Raoultibacter phocaeensis TaxID=2479841 RepID=UPI00111BB4DD|nr:cell wall-binding repeat-containing protein [Raoultibacter phocaeensis]